MNIQTTHLRTFKNNLKAPPTESLPSSPQDGSRDSVTLSSDGLTPLELTKIGALGIAGGGLGLLSTVPSSSQGIVDAGFVSSLGNLAVAVGNLTKGDNLGCIIGVGASVANVAAATTSNPVVLGVSAFLSMANTVSLGINLAQE